MIVTERKYALTRIKAGDYLLPSNDEKTLWRIAAYEDGPSHGVEEWPRDEEFWGLWRFDSSPRAITDDDLDWNRWQMIEGYFSTRREAVDYALTL